MTGRLVAIILNYRTPHDAIACAEAVLADDWRDGDRVLIVDNGSGDDSAALLDKWASGKQHVAVLPLARNAGYGAGNNEGIADARASGASFAWIMNPDTRPEPGAREALLAALRRSPAAAVASPVIELPDGRVEARGGGWFDPFLTRTRVTGAGDPGFPAGSSMMCSLEALARAGDLVEDHFLYFEELDLAARLRAAGYGVVAATDARVVHAQGAATGAHRDVARRSATHGYYSTRALMMYLRRWRPAALVTAVPIRAAYALAALPRNRAYALAALRGLVAGLTVRRRRR